MFKLIALCSMLVFFMVSAEAPAQNVNTMNQFAERLHDAGVVPAKNYQRLVTDIQNSRLHSPLDFLQYCDHAALVELTRYPDDPEQYLEKIHRDISKTLPELAFTDFRFDIKQDLRINDIVFYHFIVSLRSHGNVYKQKSFYRLYDTTKKTYSDTKIARSEFYRIFNKILVDLDSPYRLHIAWPFISLGGMATYDESSSGSRFGIVALKKAQVDMIQRQSGHLLEPSYERYKGGIKTAKIYELISGYQKAGLLDHLTTEQIKAVTDQVLQQEIYDINDVITQIPDVAFGFDTELGNLEDPYRELLLGLSGISHGAFTPTNIKDDFRDVFARAMNDGQGLQSTLEFDFNGHRYAKCLNVQDDWVDTDFFSFLDSVLVENHVKRRIYYPYTGGQDMILIFLTDEQLKYVRGNRLLLFSEDMKWNDEE